MRTPLLDRRAFLAAAGSTFAASLIPSAAFALERTDAVFATAFQRRSGEYGVAVLTEAGEMVHTLDLPERGHDVTFDPVSRRSVVFARQPGTFATVFDHTGKTPPLTIASVEGRHFYGHGCFSPDGALLYATENDFDAAEGMIGIYDAGDAFRRIGELRTYGTGPHEMLLMANGRTFAVANGGIEIHPDFGRAKLNLATMEPSLTFVDRLTGDLLARHVLPPELHQLSIRHMAPDATGKLWFGCQYEGAERDTPLLVGTATRDDGLKLLDMPHDVLTGLRNYIGAVASNPEANLVAVSSPQGNSLALIDTTTGTIRETRALTEVCGIAGDRAGFIASTGTGQWLPPARDERAMPDYVWDNHILRI